MAHTMQVGDRVKLTWDEYDLLLTGTVVELLMEGYYAVDWTPEGDDRPVKNITVVSEWGIRRVDDGDQDQD